MTTTTGRPANLLPSKQSRPRRRPSSPRRRSKRPADPRVAALELRLKQTPFGRSLLQLGDRLSEARISEQVIAVGLADAERSERSVRERLRRAEARQTAESICQAEALRMELFDAEIETRRWSRALARHRTSRELIAVELQLNARGL
jgi:hypothetical protein